MKHLMLLFLISCSDNSGLDELEKQVDRQLREQFCRAGAYTSIVYANDLGYIKPQSREKSHELAYKIDTFCKNLPIEIQKQIQGKTE